MSNRIHTRLTLHPLVRSLALVLVAASATPATWARDLNNEQAEVVAGDPEEDWSLKNGSRLTITGGTARHIGASASDVVLDAALITANPMHNVLTAMSGSSVHVSNGSSLMGSVTIYDNSTLNMEGSQIVLTTDSMDQNRFASSGVFLAPGIGDQGGGHVVIDSSLIQVEDAPLGHIGQDSGIGILVMQGQADIVNGSRVLASTVGASMKSYVSYATALQLNIHDSTLQSGRGAAIRVAPMSDNAYDITVAQGSQLIGGDGNLLLVQNYNSTPIAARTDVDFTVDDARLIGNVTLDPTTVTHGTLNVILRNKAQIDGIFSNVTTARIDGDSAWLLTGGSNVGQLTLGTSGTVSLGNGTTFNTLTVDSFIGNGGTLGFNTVLGDDTSATDTLIIRGDANGHANVVVTNAGGSGAQTSKGIELIRIGGASNAQFGLVGRAVGGSYEYFLHKDATDGGWYLRSQLATAPDPCVADPTLPQCKPIIDPIDPIDTVDPVDPITPIPVLRPEAGAYLANQFALDQLLRHGWRDRQGGNRADEGVHGWARVDGTQSKLSAVQHQLDLRVDRSRLQLGADIGVFDEGRGRIGVMGTAAQSSAASRSDLTGYSARGKMEGGALGAYGGWASDATYVDASVQRGQFRNRVQGERLAEERYVSALWQSSLEAGYRFNIGQIGSTAVSLQPELQLVYTDANIDRHKESNGTVVRSLGDSGLSGRAGLRLQGEGHSAAGASVSPYLVANWYRDGASNGMSFDDEALKAGVPRNRYELNAGTRIDFRSHLSAWGGLGIMRGDHGYRETTANVSVAYKW